MDTDIILKRGKELTLELSAMVFVRVEVWSNDDPIAELAPCQSLLRFLAVGDAVKLHEHLEITNRVMLKLFSLQAR